MANKNWVLNVFNKQAKKEEKKEKSSKDSTVKNWVRDTITADYERQVVILSNENLSEKITELELCAKGEATIPEKWSALYLKTLKSVESNRKSAEKKLLSLLKGDFSILEERVKGEAGEKGQEGSKKSVEVNEKDKDTGRKITSSLDKKALKDSPWIVEKKDGKDVIVSTEPKDAFISAESKKKLKK